MLTRRAGFALPAVTAPRSILGLVVRQNTPSLNRIG